MSANKRNLSLSEHLNGEIFNSEYSKQHTFILRCWTNIDGQTRLRLIDVQSGQGYYLDKVDQLSELISILTPHEWNKGGKK